jgi:hypothetical protein
MVCLSRITLSSEKHIYMLNVQSHRPYVVDKWFLLLAWPTCGSRLV